MYCLRVNSTFEQNIWSIQTMLQGHVKLHHKILRFQFHQFRVLHVNGINLTKFRSWTGELVAYISVFGSLTEIGL